jgi:hypothetical protein
MKRRLLILAVALLPVFMASCLNPDVVNNSTGGLYPTAPGDEPFLLVRIINDTGSDLTQVPIVYDRGTGPLTYNLSVLAGERGTGILLDWPVTMVNVGSLDSPLIPAITVQLSSGSNVVIPGLLNNAQASVDYVRGDTLVYRFTADTRNPAAINVSLLKIDGSTQTGPFTRADTFRTVRQLLELSTGSSGGTTSTKTINRSLKAG